MLRTGRRFRRSFILALAASSAAVGVALAEREMPAVLGHFVGRWDGSGQVRRNEASGPTNVRCSMAGERLDNGVRVAGTCRAYLVFSRKVTVVVRYDPKRDRFVGRYAGSQAGTARLTETARDASGVVLRVDWPKVVFGDQVAEMRIAVAGDGFRITVTDEVNGRPQPVTDLTFAPAG